MKGKHKILVKKTITTIFSNIYTFHYCPPKHPSKNVFPINFAVSYFQTAETSSPFLPIFSTCNWFISLTKIYTKYFSFIIYSLVFYGVYVLENSRKVRVLESFCCKSMDSWLEIYIKERFVTLVSLEIFLTFFKTANRNTHSELEHSPITQTFKKDELHHSCFHINFSTCFRITGLGNNSEQLLICRFSKNL